MTTTTIVTVSPLSEVRDLKSLGHSDTDDLAGPSSDEVTSSDTSDSSDNHAMSGRVCTEKVGEGAVSPLSALARARL